MHECVLQLIMLICEQVVVSKRLFMQTSHSITFVQFIYPLFRICNSCTMLFGHMWIILGQKGMLSFSLVTTCVEQQQWEVAIRPIFCVYQFLLRPCFLDSFSGATIHFLGGVEFVIKDYLFHP